MPNYGDADYWNHRYGVDFPEPFDWLFSYVDVKEILNQVIEREKEVLMIGSGNADFSPDMYNDGYHNLTNIDLSDVVIDQMKNKHPEMKWLVMDALNTTFESNSIETIVDKSLIDTILCYPNR